MAYAREAGCVVFTHDLDFGALLAVTRADGPSVILVRTQDVTPGVIGDLVHRVLTVHADALGNGAVIAVDERAARVRILPIR
jgi:predicted nuclease of predicted toxin-antitoxin system